MSIQRKILIYFSATAIGLTGISLVFIYTLFYEFREEEFQQRQKKKITLTLEYLAKVRQMDSDILSSLDEVTIQRIYDEKMLIFDSQKELIYESLDDTSIPYFADILDQLSPRKTWIEQKDGLYDVVGLYFELENKSYYGISKAYDAYGYTKLEFLRTVIFLNFIFISIVIISVSFYISRRISKPIERIAETIGGYNFESDSDPIVTGESNNEIAVLTGRFNELMSRMHEAFSFQKHAIQHISHELKTPVSVLVSNFERMEGEKDPGKLQSMISAQKEDTKSLSEIIDALLEISKAETGREVKKERIRVDELIFDIGEELQSLHPDFQFFIDFKNIAERAEHMTVVANGRLLKSAFTNLMFNSIRYSSDDSARIWIETSPERVTLSFINRGRTIDPKEQQYMFRHFFRGENSKHKRGFGLGLVFIHKIILLHGGTVDYSSGNGDTNTFTVKLPV